MNTYDEIIKLIERTKRDKLTNLDLSADVNNPDSFRLNNIPEEIFELTDLESLSINNNNLVEISNNISNLKRLKKLEISGNDIARLSDSIYDLGELESLDASYNHLKEISKKISGLHKLKNLNISWNEIKNLPVELLQLEQLDSLELRENPLVSPPPEIAGRGLEVINSYFRQLIEGTSYLYEAKLVVVGEGGAGKTTLVHKILNTTYQIADESTTQGVSISKWEFERKDKEKFSVNLWDFGGQEIYHATHQLFMSQRSLYLLVVDTRREDTDFYYWLNTIDILSNNSPIIIVKNEKQDRHREINERQLIGQFDNIKAILSVNFATNRGVNELVEEIKLHIQNLPHVGMPIPRSWEDIRIALEDEKKNYINLSEYLYICSENGVTGKTEAFQISQFLSDMGAILHFHEDPLLRKILILNTDWMTKALYMVLDSRYVIKNFGKFTTELLNEIWKEEVYSSVVAELLQIMLKFNMCYQVPGQKGTYIAPQLIGENEPKYYWEDNDNSYLRFAYEFMPKGIMSRLIVVFHQFIYNNFSWRRGVIIERFETYAEITEHYGKREIHIRAYGQHKGELLKTIVYEITRIHGTYSRLRFTTLIPCNCSICSLNQSPHFYRSDVLEGFFAKKISQIQCPTSYEMVDVPNLLFGLERNGFVMKGEKTIDKQIDQSLMSQELHEAKLLIVGEPGAGKTSLMKKLIDPLYVVPTKEESTIGITVRPWAFKVSSSATKEFMASIWDFGGQEIQYMIHHFFLTSRALYVLVADDREQRTEFDYWFRIINLLGDSSPVLVVLNEVNSKTISNFDYNSYQKRYETLLIERRDVDLAKDDGRFDSLRLKIQTMLNGIARVRETIPIEWKNIRKKLQDLRLRKNYISIDEYFDICISEGIKDEKERLELSSFLHDLGVVLHFQKESDLFNIIILNPSWAVDGAYAILANPELEKRGGRFNKQWIFQIFEKMGYSFQERNNLLNLMKKDVFELCYQLPQNDEFIVPKLLLTDRPNYVWNNKGNLRFQFQYPFMPKGIVPRLIVRLNEHIKTDNDGKDIVWSKGVVIAKGKAEAEIKEDINKKGVNVISIHVCGIDSEIDAKFDKKDLLTIIREQILEIHRKSFGKIEFDQLIPCNCAECLDNTDPELYTMRELKRFLEHKEKIQCRHSFIHVDPVDLIEDVIGLSKYADEQSQQATPINIHIHQGDEKVSNTTVNINNSNMGNLILNSSVQNSFNQAVSADIPNELKDVLKGLSTAVDEMIKNMQKEKADETVGDLENLVKEATKSSPRKSHIKVTAEGLIKAAETVGKIGEPVIKLAGKVIAMFLASGI